MKVIIAVLALSLAACSSTPVPLSGAAKGEAVVASGNATTPKVVSLSGQAHAASTAGTR